MLSYLLIGIAKAILLLSLLIAPWYYGGNTLSAQVLIYSLITVSFFSWILGSILSDRTRINYEAIPLMAMGSLVMALIACQMIPIWNVSWYPEHAVIANELQTIITSNSEVNVPITISQSSTLHACIQFGFILITCFMTAHLVYSERDTRWLATMLLINGVAIVLFGIAQSLSWNGELFWSIPLRYGGEPFGPFVNRNNAAGYLNLVCAFGVILLSLNYSQDREISHAPHSISTKLKVMAPLSVLTILIMVGIFASLSRGGIISLIAGWGVLLSLGSHKQKLTLSLLAIVLLSTCWLTIEYFGIGHIVDQRLSMIDAETIRDDLRWIHWSSMLPAWWDAPLLGTGLGTYGDMNPPYLSYQIDRRHLNADNLFLELLLELGVVGLLLILLGIGVLIHRSLWMIRLNSSFSMSLGFALLFAMTTQVLQHATDFGLLLPANGLTAATLIGIALTQNRPKSTQPPTTSSRISFALLSCLLLSGGLYGVRQVNIDRETEQYCNRVSEYELLGRLEHDELYSLIRTGYQQVKYNNDSENLHIQMCRLWLMHYYYTVNSAEEHNSVVHFQHNQLDECIANLMYSLVTLDHRSDSEYHKQLLMDPVVQSSLVPASHHLLQVYQLNPWRREIDRTLFYLSCLHPESPLTGTQALARDVLRNPTNTYELHWAAKQYHIMGQVDMMAFCFRRELNVDPSRINQVLGFLRSNYSPDFIVEHIFPQDPQFLYEVLIYPSHEWMTEAVSDRLKTMIDGEESMEDGFRDFLSAWFLWKDGQYKQSLPLMKSAVDHQPDQSDWRFHLAKTYIALEQWELAKRELSICDVLSPQDRAVQSMMKRVRQQLLLEPSK